ncbi:MAG: hypothetical protein U0575_06895 [Phycisphaerales bacterium]
MHSNAAPVLASLFTLIVAVAPPVPSSSPADESPFKLPWTTEQLIDLRAKAGIGQTPLNAFARWASPGLDRKEFDALLDEVGVPPTDADRRELVTLWEGHRARMIALHLSTARALWETAERMGPEWEREPWSKALMALSASQGRRMADAELASIDDVRGLLIDVAGRIPPDRAEPAQFVFARTVDELLREDDLVVTYRAGGAQADLWRLVRQASRDLTDGQQSQIRPILRRLYAATDEARRSLVQEGNRTQRIGYYIKAPDERRLREVRAELRSPKSQQLLELIRDAVQRAVDEMEVVIGPEASARLRALLDAASSSPPGTPEAAFPDPAQGELKCQLLSIDAPPLPEERAELLKALLETSCVGLSRINAELRSNEWTQGMLNATWADEPQQRDDLLNRRRALLSERRRANDEFRELLGAALDASMLRDLERRLN